MDVNFKHLITLSFNSADIFCWLIVAVLKIIYILNQRFKFCVIFGTYLFIRLASCTLFSFDHIVVNYSIFLLYPAGWHFFLLN